MLEVFYGAVEGERLADCSGRVVLLAEKFVVLPSVGEYFVHDETGNTCDCSSEPVPGKAAFWRINPTVNVVYVEVRTVATFDIIDFEVHGFIN